MGTIAKYLARYAEHDIRRHDISEVYDCTVVIPALNENEMLPGCLESLAKTGKSALVILVVNADHEHPIEWRENNLRLLRETPDRIGPLTVLKIDRTSEPLPPKSGVGLARKIGCDIALHLIHEGKVRSQWIRTTDADARVGHDYLDDFAGREHAAWIYPYQHQGESASVHLYDTYLRYYEAGLRSAGSPYAFPTIGSLFAFRAQSYAEIRGFPKREAGEDFYFINKARKVGTVGVADRMPIQLMARRTVRVPFGTTKSQLSIEQTLESGQNYLVYDPKVFTHLRSLLDSLLSLRSHRCPDRFRAGLAEATYAAWTAVGGDQAIATALTQRKTEATLSKHLDDWFDAFRTLKFIHHLTEHRIPKITATQAFRTQVIPVI